MKIDTKPLAIGKNSMEIEGSWSQVDQADEIMIAMYSIDAHDDMVKSLQAERDAMKNSMNFLKDLFGLSTKQVDKIYNHVDSQTLNLYMSYVCGLVKGGKAESFADFEREVEETKHPKEQPVKSDE